LVIADRAAPKNNTLNTPNLIAIKLNIVNRSMVNSTYVEPVKDFFDRYGLSVAILLLKTKKQHTEPR
jgi:hypothetical protein